jgi:hypothetical protein
MTERRQMFGVSEYLLRPCRSLEQAIRDREQPQAAKPQRQARFEALRLLDDWRPNPAPVSPDADERKS